jgi:hypothetical protein
LDRQFDPSFQPKYWLKEKIKMNKKAVNMIGFWSALLAFVFSNTFTVGAVVGGMLPKPWDAILPIAPSLLLAPTFAVMMVAVYHAAPEDRKIWGNIALVFATLYAAIASIVYVTWLFVLEPHVMRGTEASIQAFTFGPGTFLQMLDGMAYFYSCLAAFFTAPLFTNKGLERWLRWTAIANGIVAIPVFLSYFYFNTALGIWWSITIPLFTILLAIYFKRR